MFFSNFSDDVDYDSPVNALALICALLLTVPFGLITVLNGSFYQNLEAVMKTCPNQVTKSGDSYNDYYARSIQNIGNIVYACLCGLILSSMYYIFKPQPSTEQNDNGRIKLKCLIFGLASCTVAAIVGVMDITSYMVQMFMIQNNAICNYDSSYVWVTGMLFVIGSCLVGVIALF